MVEDRERIEQGCQEGMAVEIVIDIILCQRHVSIRVVAGEVEPVVEQAPAANLAPVGLKKFRTVVVDEQCVEHHEDTRRCQSEPSLVLANGKDMKRITHVCCLSFMSHGNIGSVGTVRSAFKIP